MRAAIFNPYLDTLGGGERYTMAVCKTLVSQGHVVDLQWSDAKIKKKLEGRFGIKLDNVNIVSDISRGDGYDICFWVSDGSIPALKARKNILHFQVPFKDVGGKSLINKMKLFRVNHIVSNSKFTKKFIDEEYGVESIVIYPPVDIKNITPKKKENIILFVGRFSQLKQVKNQHILLANFKRLWERGIGNWRLVLAGGVEVGGEEYLKELRKEIGSYPVIIYESPNFIKIKEIFGKAKIFWSASGFGVDENIDPEKVEHFGITPVEAMSAGCVPIIFNAGGHKEIVNEGIDGFLWDTEEELIEKTLVLSKNDQKRNHLSKASVNSAKKYSYERFNKEFSQLIK